ncbi:MAG: Bug family tripartite tricarboxylate transporter substrate binding protein [Armatimonadota bacterium]
MRQMVLVMILAMLFAGAPAVAQAPYYAGKTVELLVPSAVGGATDILNRFLAPFLEKHIPGSPSVQIRNMPGGGSILGTNWFAANAKPDGTTVLASTVSSKVAYMLQNPAARYDFRKMRLVAINGSGGVFYASPRAGIRQAADLAKAQGLTFGSNVPPGATVPALLAFELLGVNPRVVFGFESRGPIRLAFERGELSLDFQATFVYNSQVLPQVREGKVVGLMTLGFINEKGEMVRDPAVPDLPTVYEVYQQAFGRKPDGLLRWKAYRALVAASWTYGRGLWVPEGAPPEALRALHDAVDRMNRDREFLAQANKLMEGYPLLRGDTVERQVHRSLGVTLDVAKYVRDLMQGKYGVSI